eukprot:3504983-Amphidinium_carterae.1
MAKTVRDFWILVGPKLRDRPEAWPRVKLPPLVEEQIVVDGLAEPVAHDAQAPHVEGPHKRVVNYITLPDVLIGIDKRGKPKGSSAYHICEAR